jgi:phytoene dehydrogenase-like protein
MITDKDPVLVVGGGLSGLLAAAKLTAEGKSVILAEKGPRLGGRFSPEMRAGFSLGNGFAASDGAWWKQVAHGLGIPAKTSLVQHGGALLHSPKGWVAPEHLPQWESYWRSPCEEVLQGGMAALVEQLESFFRTSKTVEIRLECPVTTLQVQEGRVVSATLGAQEKRNVSDVVWCGPFRPLVEALEGDELPKPGTERIAWIKNWMRVSPEPAVVLEFAHKKSPIEFQETLFLPLPAEGKEQKRFLAGAFLSNRDPSLAPEGKGLSNWFLPLTEEEWGDNHETMKKIRVARRVLEKAFPSFADGVEWERVVVLDHSFASRPKKKTEWKPLLSNCQIGSDWALPGGANPQAIAETFFA